MRLLSLMPRRAGCVGCRGSPATLIAELRGDPSPGQCRHRNAVRLGRPAVLHRVSETSVHRLLCGEPRLGLHPIPPLGGITTGTVGVDRREIVGDPFQVRDRREHLRSVPADEAHSVMDHDLRGRADDHPVSATDDDERRGRRGQALHHRGDSAIVGPQRVHDGEPVVDIATRRVHADQQITLSVLHLPDHVRRSALPPDLAVQQNLTHEAPPPPPAVRRDHPQAACPDR